MSGESPQTPSSGGGGGKLETLSKDDLIKFAKRQTMLLSKAKASINELSKKPDPSGEIHLILQQKDEIQGELNQTKQQRAQLQEKLDELDGELTEVKAKYEEAEEERLSAVTAYQSLQKTLEETVTMKDQVAKDLESRITQLASGLRSLEEENECLKLQHSSTLDSVKAIQLEYQKVVEEKVALIEQQKVKSGELDETNRIKEKLIVSFKALKQRYLETKKELEAKAEDQPAESATKPASTTDEFDSLKSQIEVLQSQNDELSRSLSESQSHTEDLKAQIEKVKSENEETIVKFDDLQLLNGTVSGKLEELEAERETMSGKLEALEAQRETMSGKLEALEAERETMSGKLEALEAERETMSGNLEALEAERKTMLGKLEALEADRENMAGKLVALEAEKENLQEKFKEADSANETMTRTLREMEEEKGSMLRNLKELAQQSNHQEIITDDGESMETLADKYKSGMANMEKKMECMKAEYEETIQTLQTEVRTLNEELTAIKETESQSKQRVEELVLGLGKESVGVIAELEEKIAGHQIEKEELMKTIEDLRSSMEETVNTNHHQDVAKATKDDVDSNTVQANQKEEDTLPNEALKVETVGLDEGAMAGPISENEKDEVISSLSKELTHAKGELAHEKRLTKSLQDMVQTLSGTLRGLEGENKRLAGGQSGEEVVTLNTSALIERIQLLEASRLEKIAGIQKLGDKMSELVDYAAKLQAKCEVLTQANDQLTNTVTHLERRIAVEARGSRDIELSLQEAENNMNEQIAHFTDQRHGMAERVREYAANIEALRAEMLPFKDKEKECGIVLYRGLCNLTEQQHDAESTPQSSLVEMAKLVVSMAQKFKTQFIILSGSQHQMANSENWVKRIALNWKFRSEQDAVRVMKLEKKLAKLEEKIVELGGSTEDIESEPEEDPDIKPLYDEGQKVEDEELRTVTSKFQETELTRMYKEMDKLDRDIHLLKVELKKKDEQLKEANFVKKETIESTEQSSQQEEQHSGEESTGQSDSGPEEPDVRPKVKSGIPKPVRVEIHSTMTQTEEHKMDDHMEKTIKIQKEIIDSLRLELNKEPSDGRVVELTKNLNDLQKQLSAKDTEIERLSAAISRQKIQLNNQSDALCDLNIQLNKKQVQERFHIQVGDTRQSELQGALSSAVIELKEVLEEKEVLIAQIEELQDKVSCAPVAQDVRTRDEELNYLRNECDELRGSLQKMKEDWKEFLKMHNKLNSENEKLIGLTDKLTAINGEMKQELTELRSKSREKNSAPVVKKLEEMNQLKESIDSLLTELKEEREKSDKEKEALGRKLNNYEIERVEHGKLVAELHSERDSLLEEIENLSKDKVALADENKDNSTLVLSLTADIKSKVETIVQLEEQLEEQLIEREKLESDRNQIEQELNDLRTATELLGKKVEAAESEADKYKMTLEELRTDLDDKETKLNNFSTLMEEQKDLQCEKDRLQAVIAEQQLEIVSLNEVITTGGTNHKDLEERVRGLQEDINVITGEKEDMGRHIEQLKVEYEQVHKNYEGLEEQTGSQKAATSQLDEALTAARISNKSLEEKVERLQSQIKMISEEKETLAKQSEQLQADYEHVSKDHQELLAKAEGQQTEIDQLNEAVMDGTRREKEVERLQSQINMISEEKETLAKLSQQLQADYEHVSKGHQELLAKAEGQQTEIDQLNEAVMDGTRREKEVERLQSQINMISEEKETLAKLSEQLQADYEHVSKGHQELLAKAEGQQTEIDQLNEAVMDGTKREAEVDGFQSQINVITNEKETLESQMKQLQADYKQVNEGNQELVVQAESQQTEIERLANLNENLQKALDDSRKELMETSMSSQTSAASEEEASSKLKEAEDRANKFKMLALKAKKELMETRATVEKLKTELQERSTNKVGDMQTLVNNYQHLQQNCDKLQDDLDTERANVSELQSKLESEQTTSSQIQNRLAALVEEKENVVHANSQLVIKVKTYESQQNEWKAKMLSLEKESDVKQLEINELNKNLSKLTEQLKSNDFNSKALEDKLRGKINELELKVHEARDELEQVNKTVSKSSVMDLEIADFERTVSTLNALVKDKEDIITNLEQELEHNQQRYASLEHELASADEQRQSVESRSEKMQQMLTKTKQELDDARQQENQSKTTDLAMRGELEILRQQHEDLKLEVSDITSGRLLAEDKLKASQDAQQRLIRSMENKQRALQSDLESSRSELTLLHQEYDGYKVRVHSVLKQQQTRASVEAALESEKVEKEHLQEVLNQVKVKLQETSDKLQASLSENGLLQDELDKLSLKHNKISQEFTSKEGVWRQRLDQLMLENSTISAEHSTSISQMSHHTEIMTQTFKEQMKASQTEHEHQLNSLNSRIGRLEEERLSLVAEVQNLRQQLGSVKPEQVKPLRTQHSRQKNASPAFSPPDAKYNVRESGEGMEHPQPLQFTGPQAMPQQGATNTLAGLEQLLTSADDDTASVVSLGTQFSETGDEAKLKNRLQLSEKQQEHLRELLNDSEATCVRFNEQVKILKQEIRRLESNQKREQSISNMEYLKNIVYKFLSLEAGDERSRLLPVLHTMLKFTDEELSTLRAIAASGTEAEGTGQGQGSWSGYLHRWTGFSS